MESCKLQWQHRKHVELYYETHVHAVITELKAFSQVLLVFPCQIIQTNRSTDIVVSTVCRCPDSGFCSAPTCCPLNGGDNSSSSALAKLFYFVSCKTICGRGLEGTAFKSSTVIYLYISVVAFVSWVLIIESASMLCILYDQTPQYFFHNSSMPGWKQRRQFIWVLFTEGKKGNRIKHTAKKEPSLFPWIGFEFTTTGRVTGVASRLLSIISPVNYTANKSTHCKTWILNNNRKRKISNEERIGVENNLTACKTCFCSTARITEGLLNC